MNISSHSYCSSIYYLFAYCYYYYFMNIYVDVESLSYSGIFRECETIWFFFPSTSIQNAMRRMNHSELAQWHQQIDGQWRFMIRILFRSVTNGPRPPIVREDTHTALYIQKSITTFLWSAINQSSFKRICVCMCVIDDHTNSYFYDELNGKANQNLLRFIFLSFKFVYIFCGFI